MPSLLGYDTLVQRHIILHCVGCVHACQRSRTARSLLQGGVGYASSDVNFVVENQGASRTANPEAFQIGIGKFVASVGACRKVLDAIDRRVAWRVSREANAIAVLRVAFVDSNSMSV